MPEINEEQQLKILLEMKDFQQKMKAVDTMFTTSIKNATELGQVVDAISSKIANLSAIAEQASKKNKDFFNVNNSIKNNLHIGNSKFNDTVVIGDSALSFSKKSNSNTAQQARLAAVEALKKELQIKNEILKKEKEYQSLLKNKTALTKKRAENFEQDSNSRSINAKAKMLRAQTIAEHPELFAAGALLKNPRYQFGKVFSTIGKKAESLGVGSDKIEGRIVGSVLSVGGAFLKSPAVGAAEALRVLTDAIGALSKAAITAYGEIESIKTQLGVVFSSQSQADSIFEDISQYAIKSPFGVQQTSELAVLLKQSGVYASDLMDTLKMLGDTAGGNMEKMKRIANNYAQIMSIGKASMLDMRQFAYAGIPIFEAVSDELGVSQSRLRQLISDGKVTSEIIEKVFKNLTGVNGLFNEATQKGAKTLKARLQNLTDSKQLALSSIGEYAYSFGKDLKGDSYGGKLLSLGEKIYSYLYDFVSTVNLENSVKSIEERNSDIAILNSLIKSAQNKGDKNAEEFYQKKLDELLKAVNPDKERAELAKSAELKLKDIDNINKVLESVGLSRYKFNEDEDVKKFINSLYDELLIKESRASDLKQAYQGYRYAISSPIEEPFLWLYNTFNGSVPSTDYSIPAANALKAKEEVEVLSKVISQLEKFAKLTKLENDALKEKQLLTSQLNAEEAINKKADESNSLYNKFQELAEIYENSEEEKKRREEEHIKELQKAQKILKEINPKLGQKGELNFSNFSLSDYLAYKDLGTFKTSKRLDVTYDKGEYGKNKDKSEEELSENRKILTNQLRWYEREVSDILRQKGLEQYSNELITRFSTISSLKDDKSFYKGLKNFYKDTETILKKAQKDAPREDKELFDKIISALSDTALLQETINGGKNAIIGSTSSANYEIIPLWKRILAENTGVSANVITSSSKTLEAFNSEVIPRKMAKGIFAELLNSNGDVNSIEKFIASSGNMKLMRGTNEKEEQIDWSKVKTNIEKFAMQLNTTTRYVEAYRNALNSQLDTYLNLINESVTTYESQDLKSQKTISAKALDKLIKDGDEQFVNAFFPGMINTSGVKVGAIKNGIAYGEDGRELLNQEIVYSEKMYEILQAELPKIREKIANADKMVLKNSIMQTSAKTLKDNLIENSISSFALSGNKELVSANREIIKEYLNKDLLQVVKEKYKEDITDEQLTDYIANGYITVTDVRQSLEKILQDVIRSSDFSQINKTLEEQKELTKSLSFFEYGQNNLREKPELYSFEDFLYNKEGNSKQKFFDSLVTKDVFTAIGMEPIDFSKLSYEEINNVRADTRTKALAFGEDLYEGRKRALSSEEAKSLNATEEQAKILEDENAPLQRKLEILSEILEINKDITEQDARQLVSQLGGQEAVQNMLVSFKSIGKETAKKAFTTAFESLGSYMVLGTEASEDLKDNMKDITAQALQQVGAAMTTCGFQIAGSAAVSQNWGMVAAGLGLAAMGGIVGGVGNALSKMDSSNTDNDDKTQKLEDLSNKLADLLDQAREDAGYYERNLRHRTALGINARYSNKVTSVNDAIITPSGNVISTAPDDYLIATKTPETLVSPNNNVNVQPKVSVIINKNTRANVDVNVEQRIEPDGSVQLVAMIEDMVGQYIASNRSNEAFEARQAMLQGRRSIM